MLTRKKVRLADVPKCDHSNCNHLAFFKYQDVPDNFFNLCYQHANDAGLCLICGQYSFNRIVSDACPFICGECDAGAMDLVARNIAFCSSMRILYEKAAPRFYIMGFRSLQDVPESIFFELLVLPLSLVLYRLNGLKLSELELIRFERCLFMYFTSQESSFARVIWARYLFDLGFLNGFIYKSDSSYKPV